MIHLTLEKMAEYSGTIESIGIFAAILMVVYSLSSLYYWTIIDLKRSRPYHLVRDLDLGRKRVRQNVAPKNNKDLT